MDHFSPALVRHFSYVKVYKVSACNVKASSYNEDYPQKAVKAFHKLTLNELQEYVVYMSVCIMKRISGHTRFRDLNTSA